MDDLSRACLLAVEILLADPEALRNDALEADLYLLRDQLQAPAGRGNGRLPASPSRSRRQFPVPRATA